MRDRRLLIPPSLGVACSGQKVPKAVLWSSTPMSDVLLQPLATPSTGLGAAQKTQGNRDSGTHELLPYRILPYLSFLLALSLSLSWPTYN